MDTNIKNSCNNKLQKRNQLQINYKKIYFKFKKQSTWSMTSNATATFQSV